MFFKKRISMLTMLFGKQLVYEATNPPLRFSGNKKHWQEFIEKLVKDIPSGATIVDAFGGCGIISYYIITYRPDINVIYNDFDGYIDRLDHIDDLEEIRSGLQKIAGNRSRGKIRKDDQLDKNPITDVVKKKKILKYLDDCKARGMFVDFNVISTWLTYGFSANKLTADCVMVNNIPANPLNTERAKEYADVLRPLRHKFDIRSLFTSKRLQKLLKDNSVYWVLDPPYRDTNDNDYKNGFSKEIEDSIKEIIKTNRVILFCDEKEKDVYKRMFKTKCKVKNKKKMSFFYGASRIESCLYSI